MPEDRNTDLLCRELRANIDAMTLEWVRRVQHDPYMKSDDTLTLAQIVDHVPQMLEEICALLSRDAEPDFQTIRASSQHGYMRSAEGYSLPDLLRELELLRDCVFNFVAETEIAHEVSRAETIRALRLVNHYFGEDTLFVVEHFLARERASRSQKG
ncbi:MAG: RsbRD N-terminal domain-containing protein [Acidobacteria bacterium]|nr:RsbRD N-terminal domain-containing protein [Acidobacteriota bacterium]MCA1641984.1 RsbRD N-terminal domain-containing protein [Acidobacteriota bacterium]